MAGNDAAQTPDSEDLTPVSRQGLGFTTTLPFGSTQLYQAWQTGLVWTSTFTISILVWRHSPSHQPYLLHSLTQAACNPTFADHGMTASVAGSLVNVGTATAVIDVNGTTLTSTAPFVLPNRMNSAPEQLLHLGTNASGVEAVSRSPKAPYLKNDVNSVQLFRLVLVLRSSYSVLVNVVVSLASDIFYCGQFRVNEPPISSTTGNSITGAVQQDLVPPFRVTPPPFIADKLSRKLCFHPDQRKVDFVISGITIGFLGAMTCRCHEPHFSELIALSLEVLRLGVGAHGWVARICQPLEKSPSRSLLPILEAPGCFRHPTCN